MFGFKNRLEDPEIGELLDDDPDQSHWHRSEWRRKLPYMMLKGQTAATRTPESQILQSQGETNVGHGDSSGPLFTLYSKLAVEEDNKMVERWQKDAEGIIIFTGLFSAVVTALVAVSIQDLRPNTQDTSSFYLEKLYQLQVNPNVSSTPFHSVAVQPPAFSPPGYAIWVNLLWFLSLVISLTCAMLATLLQQWARRYIRTTQLPRSTPRKRAQMRAFFAKGVDRFQVAWAVEALPALVHLSVFLFFAGLLIFLLHINHTVFGPVFGLVVLSSAVYACITFLPIIWHDSPYYAPLSSAAWLLCTTIPYVFFAAMTFIPFRHSRTFWIWRHFFDLRDRYRLWISGGIEKAAEETTSERASEINSRIVEWTVDALGEDDALEKFLEAIPGFCQSDVAEEHNIPREVQEKIEIAAGNFLNRTFSSGSVCRSVVESRVSTCLNAARVVGGPSGVAKVLRTMVDGNLHVGPQSVEMGHFLMRWVKSEDILVTVMAEVHCVVALILQGTRERDDRWKALALDHLGVSEQDLENYLAHGDSVLLASLVCVICQLIPSPWEWTPFSALQALSTLNICGTFPYVRGSFCLMWNKLLGIARVSGKYSPPVGVLNCIRHLYIPIHTCGSPPTAFYDTSSLDDVLFHPSSYPTCLGHGLLHNCTGEVPSILTDPRFTEWLQKGCRRNDPDPVEDPAIVTPPTRLDASFKSLRSPTPEHTASPTVDESSLSDALSPISTSPHSPLPMPLVNPVQSLDPDIAITTQSTIEHNTVTIPSTPTASSGSFHRDGSYMHSPLSLPSLSTCAIPNNTWVMSSLLSIYPTRLLHFPYHSHFPETRNLIATQPPPGAGQPSPGPPSIENTPLVDQPGDYVCGPNVELDVVSLYY